MPIRARTLFLFHWAVIAIKHEAEARKGRERTLVDRVVGSTDEFYSATIAIAASTHALDALYGELAEHVAPQTLAAWEAARRGGRPREIAAILELAVDADVEAWQPRLRTLFEERRNPVVHPKVRWVDLVEHPELGMVDADEATYTFEAAQESVDLLLEILTACAEAPKHSVKKWATQIGGGGLSSMVEYLKADRAHRAIDLKQEEWPPPLEPRA